MEVNLIALFTAAFAYFFLGALWYSPLLFGKAWMTAMKFDQINLKEVPPPTKGYIFSFIGAFLTAFALTHMTNIADATILSHIKYAAMAWVGFIAASQMGAVYFNYLDKSPGKIFFINTGYNLVGFILIAVILALFK